MRPLSFILLFLPFLSPCQDRKAAIESLLSKAGIPGLSLVYVKNGSINEIYNLGIRSTDGPEMIDSSSIFAAASLSKSVFAYAVMNLVAQGKLNLDKPVSEYFDYSEILHDSLYKKVTARQLLSHTSGLPNWRNSQKVKFKYPPGKQFSYSGEGFVWLSKVVEKITGMKTEEWMQKTVFLPLHMTNSSYVWQDRFKADVTQPHSDFGKTSQRYYPENANVAHSLQTTAADYGKFLVMLLNKKLFKSASSLEIFKPQPNSFFQNADSHLAWGAGLGYAHVKNVRSFWQWGDNDTYKAFLIGYPDRKEGLVYFANSSNGLAIAGDLLQLFFKDEQPELKWLDYPSYNSAAFQLLHGSVHKSFADAVKKYMKAGTDHQDTSLLNEGTMADIGTRLLQLKKWDDGLAVFNMNKIAFPNSADAEEKLGLAYLGAGNRTEGVRNLLASFAKDSTRTGLKQIVDRVTGVADTSTGTPTLFQLREYADARNVQIAGSFNDWSDTNYPMQWKDGLWTTTINLKAGQYKYKFIVDGVWIPDPTNSQVKKDENIHSVIDVK